MSTKKINEALGIESIDDFLSDIDISDDIRQLNDIDEQVQENVGKIDTQVQEYRENGIQNVNLCDISTSLNELKDLIKISKDTIVHVYDSITSSELVDSELVGSLSKLMEATHLTVSEYINLFKDRLAFYDKVRFEAVKHRNDMEKIKYKHDLDMEKMKAKESSGSIDVSSSSYSQEDIVKMIQDE